MIKRDLIKEMKHLYLPTPKSVVLIEVPSMQYLMLDGEGDPNTAPAFKDAVESLFSLAYKIKFAIKKGPMAMDYKVMPLEGFWWTDNMADFSVENKSIWKWTLAIMQPEWVTAEHLEIAKAEVQKKKNQLPLKPVRLETINEGTCAQILHIGPFSEEGPTVARVHDFIQEKGQLTGKHHEIYLSDTRKADPKKWKTVIRQPMTFCW